MKWQHVYPFNDLINHTTDSFEEGCCVCNPTIDVDNYLVIHDAMDRRECFEEPDEVVKNDGSAISCPDCGGDMVQCGDVQECSDCDYKRISG